MTSGPRREAGYLIAQIHQIGERILARKLKEHGLDQINPPQGRILFALWRRDGISIQELGTRTKLAKSTLTAMLDRLEASGFVRRTPAETDRREVLINLTAKDRALRKAYNAVSQEMTALFYRGLGEEERDRFEGYLRRILDNLTGYEDDR
ncbi:MAG: MarR family transcriptional regulator [Candidatus Zixiibacteriota bacterium]|jgi:DNA-binding MarR family transcriptional regulator